MGQSMERCGRDGKWLDGRGSREEVTEILPRLKVKVRKPAASRNAQSGI
jgi:hypothetical protein